MTLIRAALSLLGWVTAMVETAFPLPAAEMTASVPLAVTETAVSEGSQAREASSEGDLFSPYRDTEVCTVVPFRREMIPVFGVIHRTSRLVISPISVPSG